MDFGDTISGKSAVPGTWSFLTRDPGSRITTLYYCPAIPDTFAPRWLRSAVACCSFLLSVQSLELFSGSVNYRLFLVLYCCRSPFRR